MTTMLAQLPEQVLTAPQVSGLRLRTDCPGVLHMTKICLELSVNYCLVGRIAAYLFAM
jgi:hypothetical protein